MKRTLIVKLETIRDAILTVPSIHALHRQGHLAPSLAVFEAGR